MEGKEEDVRLGANRYSEHQPIGTAAQGGGADEKDYKEPPPAPFFEAGELTSWSFYRAGIAEFLATFLFLYISVLTVMGVVGNPSGSKCGTVGIQGIAWSFGGMIFVLVYCTAGISGGHINPAVTFGLFLARKLSLTRATAAAPTPSRRGTPRGTGLGLRLLGRSCWCTPSSPPPTPSAAPETPTSPFWRRFRSGSRCSWCTWPRSPSRAPASTRRGPWAPPSSTTRSRRGTTTGSSGWVRSSARRWRPSTTWW
ncbi:unnamed protein product [Triticum turgidum subsp. durum]|uniref:Aquaporin n=1 Tax=Triticum turgidum subsp. durum TaxID=4567 RepID=A0A9R0YXA4_TRITD|nr:unnamed protein product [Triticum turgidum subsp. durum]